MDDVLMQKIREAVGEGNFALRQVWVAYTNTDCTEGRGYDVPIAVCDLESTARRRARRAYVQGVDGPVRPMKLIRLGGVWYAPYGVFHVENPSLEDISAQSEMDARMAVLEKIRAAGLTDEELRLIAK